MALRCEGYKVELAQDGDEVLACLQAGKSGIAAVLLDIIMPHKDGLDVLREIRSVDKDLPIIMISGASSPLNVVDAMKSGATDFLGKPVNHDDLRRTIKVALEKRVNDVVTQAKSDLDSARKAGAQLSFWMVFALLVGAFSASIAAAEAGAFRDRNWGSLGA